MKRLAIMLCVAASVVCANAKILRVSNVNGSTAPYSSVTAALEAANDGDVIMLDASPDSYGDIEINKKVTLQGPGYWLIDNGIVQEGMQTADFGTINITASGAKLSSVSAYAININGDRGVVTRCWVQRVGMGDGIEGAIIHQNYITTGIGGPSYFDILPSNIQITNNIFRAGLGCLRAFCNSIVKYNTFTISETNISLWCLRNSVFEYNIVKSTQLNNNGGNTFTNNSEWPDDFKYNNKDIDSGIKTSDATISPLHGAFAGEDPYVISGIASGPYIEDITVPVSVEQGDDMKVTLKIGTSR